VAAAIVFGMIVHAIQKIGEATASAGLAHVAGADALREVAETPYII
jgi:hypothetical protein